MSDDTHPTAWKPLIDLWVEREKQLRPHLPVRGESVRVRDAVEVGDQAYVLLSFDVDHPWPTEENLGDGHEARADGAHTAVLQAERNRLPWRERDSTRSASSWTDGDESVIVHEHLLGTRRAFSGSVVGAPDQVRIEFEDGDPVDATVVDGWFLAIVPDERRVRSITLDAGSPVQLERNDVDSLLAPIARQNVADAMYFSPLDLRSVLPIVQWVRSGDVVAVCTCLEQYDEGGILRLRIDGVRTDDDTFVTWPSGTIEIDGEEIGSTVCGESALADTLSLDIGFRPWLPTSAREIAVRIDGVRGAQGEIEPMVLAVRIPGAGS